MNSATLTILSKLIATQAKDARSDLMPGKHEVNESVTINVSGTVTVGEDYDQRIVLKADPWLIAVAALSHLNGVTVDSIVREALEMDAKLVKNLKAEAQVAMDAINASTVTSCKGKVTVSKDAVAVTAKAAPALSVVKAA